MSTRDVRKQSIQLTSNTDVKTGQTQLSTATKNVQHYLRGGRGTLLVGRGVIQRQ